MSKMIQLSKNEILVLRAVFRLHQATRNHVKKQSGLSSFIVSSALSSLIEKGAVQIKGVSSSSRGRPSQLYQVNPGFGYSLGISIDSQSLRILLTNSQKEIVREKEYPIESIRGSEPESSGSFEQINRLIKEFKEAYAPSNESLLSIGVAVPGMIDTEKGIWLDGIRLQGVHHLHLREMIEKGFPVPIVIEDVARAVAYLELCIGRGKGVRDFVLLHLGYGFGTGIVINNLLYRGTHGMAGEFGHIVLDSNGYRCGCGKVGCLDTIVSVPGILRRVNDRLNEVVAPDMPTNPLLAGKNPVTIEDVINAARQGDRLMSSILYEIGVALGDVCEHIIMIFNPRKLIISGSLSILKDLLEEPITQTIRRKVPADMLTDLTIEFSDYSPEHEAYGAALLAMDSYWH